MDTHIGFKIVGIKTEQFAIIESNFSEKKKNEVITDLEFKANKDGHQIIASATFTFKSAGKPFIILQIECRFAIAETSWQGCFNGNTAVFPKDFMTHLTVMTVGTARGVLHTKTEGTPFNRFLLPTINVPELVTGDIQFVFQE